MGSGVMVERGGFHVIELEPGRWGGDDICSRSSGLCDAVAGTSSRSQISAEILCYARVFLKT